MLVKSVFGWIGLADNTTCPELAQARTVPPSPGEGGGTVRAWGLGSQARAWRHLSRPTDQTLHSVPGPSRTVGVTSVYAFLLAFLSSAHFFPL